MGKHLSTGESSLLQRDAEGHAKNCTLPYCRYGYRIGAPKHAAPKTLTDLVMGINPEKEK